MQKSNKARTVVEWPKFMFAAGGKQQVFDKAEDVPAKGWYETPQEADAAERGGKAPTPAPTPSPGAAAASEGEIDAAGWPWDPSLHAATKTKTAAGLWRMKVGVARPEPKKLDL